MDKVWLLSYFIFFIIRWDNWNKK